jgi:AcrR family transcriptional regulator
MSRKQEQRAEETKRSILEAAGALFAERGYDAVTMREIAKKAGCSHTTIYLYFDDKETLLHQLAAPPLQSLKDEMERISAQNKHPSDKLKEIFLAYIHFCLANRSMHTIFFGAGASRVDEEEPALEINRLRIGLFRLLMRSLQEFLHIGQDDERLLAYSRICYFTLYGIVATYTPSKETVEQLMDRLSSTFHTAVDALLIGFQRLLKEEANHHEN